ncbi:NfeD family protein [Nocardioides marmorisolisilvae]|uniref:NfeD family protein n=1 Tax=Nocardioides marmorisolisilvae TaxID=1542737 RepID=A0A3N0DVF7_9ACTN|nr:NfeD family protein [Nocardioides marmorisolisilvae]RNL79393.1 NfeD family protein [Nocardioides marmorisolisilvae]
MDWIRDHASETWLIAALALVVLELASTDLILIMLAAGAFAGMVVAIAGGSFLVAMLVALGVSVALMWFVRPSLVHRLHAGPTLAVGAEALIGKRAHVLETISHTSPGRVKIGGDVWTAQPYDEDDQIEAGATVDVVSIKGATAYVLRVQSPQGSTTETS